MKHRDDIQILRAVSILLVLLYHLQIPGFQKGFLGVDIFFVISGYLMVGIYFENNWKQFYSKRFKKLLPAYLITIILTLLYAFNFVNYPDFIQVVKQSFYSIFLFPNLYFAEQNSYFDGSIFRPLLHFWSLGIEFQFYIIFPLLIKLIIRRKILYGIAIFSFTLNISMLLLNPKLSFYLLPMRLWEFLIGMLAFKAIHSTKKNKTQFGKFKYLFIYMALITSVFVLPISGSSRHIAGGHPGIFTLIVVLLSAFLIRLGSEISIRPNLLTNFLKKIGDSSYSIYLAHYPVIVFLGYAPYALGAPKSNMFHELIFALIIIFISTIVLDYSIRKIAKNLALLKITAVLFLVCALLLSFLPSMKLKQFSDREIQIYQSVFDRGDFRCGQFHRLTYQFMERITSDISFCKISKDFESKKILLLGDSHADAIKLEVIRLANLRQTNLYLNARNSLPLSDSFFQDHLVQSIISNRFAGVIMHFSSRSIEPKEIFSISEKLTAAGIKFVIVGPVPIWKKDVPEMLILNEFKNVGLQSQTYMDYLKVNAGYFDSTSQLILNNDNFVDTGKFMCRPDCLVDSANMGIFYWDSSHLTLKGARFLSPLLDLALGKVT